MTDENGGGWAASTDELADWCAAFVDLAADLEDITRDRTAKVETRTGGSYSYSYADLATIMTDLRPKAAKHGLAVSQAVKKDTAGHVLVWTTLLHRSGQYVTWEPLAMPAGSTPQDAGSAITYARRYSVLACLGLATEDDDGAQASQAVRTAQTQRETVPVASKSKLQKVEAAKDSLSPPALARLVLYAKAEGLPDPKYLTTEQADKVIEWIAKDNEAHPPEVPA